MTPAVADALYFVITSILWGATNPLIKAGGKGIETVQSESALKKFFLELQYLFTNIQYLVPFLVNQCGSVLFYFTLASADISLAVPITNSLTFIFTGLTGSLLGEKFGNSGTYLGLLLVLFGITLCVLSKID